MVQFRWSEKWSKSYLEGRVCKECSGSRDRVSDIEWLKIEIVGVFLNAVSGYAPHGGSMWVRKEEILEWGGWSDAKYP